MFILVSWSGWTSNLSHHRPAIGWQGDRKSGGHRRRISHVSRNWIDFGLLRKSLLSLLEWGLHNTLLIYINLVKSFSYFLWNLNVIFRHYEFRIIQRALYLWLLSNISNEFACAFLFMGRCNFNFATILYTRDHRCPTRIHPRHELCFTDKAEKLVRFPFVNEAHFFFLMDAARRINFLVIWKVVRVLQ